MPPAWLPPSYIFCGWVSPQSKSVLVLGKARRQQRTHSQRKGGWKACRSCGGAQPCGKHVLTSHQGPLADGGYQSEKGERSSPHWDARLCVHMIRRAYTVQHWAERCAVCRRAIYRQLWRNVCDTKDSESSRKYTSKRKLPFSELVSKQSGKKFLQTTSPFAHKGNAASVSKVLGTGEVLNTDFYSPPWHHTQACHRQWKISSGMGTSASQPLCIVKRGHKDRKSQNTRKSAVKWSLHKWDQNNGISMGMPMWKGEIPQGPTPRQRTTGYCES